MRTTGSPPTAAELIRRHGSDEGNKALHVLLHDWEQWSAELLESHLSYPILAYFRSQHDNESWLAALTAILDGCSLLIINSEHPCSRQASMTFAMGRHALLDLCVVFRIQPRPLERDRLPAEILAQLRTMLADAGIKMQGDQAADRKLNDLRSTYEPYLNALATYFQMSLPPWLLAAHRPDNWQGNVRPRKAGKGRETQGRKGRAFLMQVR